MIRRLLLRRLRLFYLCIAAAALFFHPVLLTWLTYPITRSDRPVDAQYLLFLRSAQLSGPAFELAAEFASQSGDRMVFVYRDFVRRSEAIGASPSFLDGAIDQLVAHGVPREQIQVLGMANEITYGAILRNTAAWLSKQSDDDQILVLTHNFQTGYLVDVANQSIDPLLRERLHIIGGSRLGVTRANWWRSATGVKYMLEDSLRLLHLWCWGEFEPQIRWDPDDYEAQLRSQTANG